MSDADSIANKIFDTYDKDKSGTIDKSELKAMLQETYKGLNYTVTDQDVNDALAAFDADHSGTISRDEYLAVVRKAFQNKNA